MRELRNTRKKESKRWEGVVENRKLEDAKGNLNEKNMSKKKMRIAKMSTGEYKK